MVTKTPARAKTAYSKDIAALKVATKAIGATEHNPIAWGAIIRLIAPIIARLAARQAIGYAARRVGKKLGTKIRAEAIEDAADRVIEIVSRQN